MIACSYILPWTRWSILDAPAIEQMCLDLSRLCSLSLDYALTPLIQIYCFCCWGFLKNGRGIIPWRWHFNFVFILSRWFEFARLWFLRTSILFCRTVPSVQGAFRHPLARWFVMCQSGRKSVILKCLLNGVHWGDSWTGGSTSWRQNKIGIAFQLDWHEGVFFLYVLYYTGHKIIRMKLPLSLLVRLDSKCLEDC